MSVEKKDFGDTERSSPGVDESGPLDLSEGTDAEAAERRKKRKRGIRVPSDNVPRPQGAGMSGPIATQSTPSAGSSVPPAAVSSPTTVSSVVASSSVASSPVASSPVASPSAASTQPIVASIPGPDARLDTDLEVDVEFVDDEAGPSGTNGDVGRRTEEMAAQSDPLATVDASPPPPANGAGAHASSDGVPRPVPRVASSPVDRAWTESSEELADADLEEDRGEPTQINKPIPTGPAQASSEAAPTTAPTTATSTTTATATSAEPAVSSSGEIAPAASAAANVPTAQASSPATDSGRVADEAEEISPAEIEEVDSGPHAAAAAHAHAPPTPPAAASRPAVSPPKPPPAAPAPAAAAAASPAAKADAKAEASQPRASAQAAAAAAASAAQPRPASKKRKGKAWYEEIFDEDYLRTLPFLTPQATQREAAFLIDGLGVKPGQQVLDLGCGYGRHAMELAARGFHVVGLDLSLPLLIRGADEAQRRGLTINFVHGDMRELTFDAQFDGAYCVFSTFGYFDDETNKRVAQNVARALKPGAKLVIDILNRDYITADLPTRVWWEGDGCVVLEEVDFNYFTSRLVSNRSVVFEDGRQLEQEISIRSYSLHELGKLLHQVGFRVTEVSGGLATRGRFFGNDSRQIIVVAERRADKDPAGNTSPDQSSPGTKPPL